MANKKQQSCENCRFWCGDTRMECRRYAPRPEYAVHLTNEEGDILARPVWTNTYSWEWCGEFEEKENDGQSE